MSSQNTDNTSNYSSRGSNTGTGSSGTGSAPNLLSLISRAVSTQQSQVIPEKDAATQEYYAAGRKQGTLRDPVPVSRGLRHS